MPPTTNARATQTADRPAATTMHRPTVRRLGEDDIPAAAALLARGFAEEPGNRAMFPDPELRERLAVLVFTHQLQATVPHATAYGAHLDGELGGAAIWHAPKAIPISVRGQLELLAGLARQAPGLVRGLPDLGGVLLRHGASVPRVVAGRQRAVAKASAGPTWHLAFLATDPQLRGRGLARCLLDHVLDRCDEDGVAAWLETTDPVNPPLYERFGFRTVGHIERAGWIPGLWVMRREPVAAPDARR